MFQENLGSGRLAKKLEETLLTDKYKGQLVKQQLFPENPLPLYKPLGMLSLTEKWQANTLGLNVPLPADESLELETSLSSSVQSCNFIRIMIKANPIILFN